MEPSNELICTIILCVLVYRLAQILSSLVRNGADESCSEMNGSELHWLMSDRNNPANITCALELDDEINIVDLRNAVDQRLLRSAENSLTSLKRLTSRIIQRGRTYFFQKVSLDICQHVLLHSSLCNEVQYRDLLDKLVSERMDMSLPLWKIILIPRLDPSGQKRTDIILQIHHSMADGVSLVRLLIEHIIDDRYEMKFNFKRQMPSSNSIGHIFQHSTQLCKDFSRFVNEMFLTPGDKSILKSHSLSGEKRVAWTKQLNLKLLRASCQLSKTTINDLLSCCLLSGLHKYLRKRGDSSKSVQMFVPIYLKSIDEALQLGNQFAVLKLQLPLRALFGTEPTNQEINLNMDDTAFKIGTKPSETTVPYSHATNGFSSQAKPNHSLLSLRFLHEVQTILQSAKQSIVPILASSMQDAFLEWFPAFFTLKVFEGILDKATLCMSNMIGPDREVKLMGRRVRSIISFIPSKGTMGLSVLVLSYNGEIRISVLADSAIMRDPQELCDHIDAALHSLTANITQHGSHM